MTQTPRSPSSSASFSFIAVAGQPQHVEGADQVDLDHVVEDLQVVRPLLAGGPLGPADPRAADRDPQAALGLGGGVDRGLDRLGLHHVRLDEPSPLAELGGERLALLGVQVGDHDRRAAVVKARAVASPSPEAPPATSAPAPSIFTGAETLPTR